MTQFKLPLQRSEHDP